MKNRKKKWIGTLLCACMAATMMPTMAHANDGKVIGKQISQGTSVIGDGDYVYYGDNSQYNYSKGAIKWRVLDADIANTDDPGLFMITEDSFGMGTKATGGIYFFKDFGNPTNIYQDSDIRGWCRDFSGENIDSNAKVLTTQELAALIETEKDDTFYNAVDYGVKCSASDNILNKDKVFCLSAEEAMTYFATEVDRTVKYNGAKCQWWLRSAVSDEPEEATTVHVMGGIGDRTVYADNTARPACNLSLSSVLLTSAAVGGKSSGAAGDLILVPDITPSDNKKEWKLTLTDTDRNAFSANLNADSNDTVCAGETIQVDYADAKTEGNEYVSVALCDENDEILYYGNIAKGSASGTADVNIPAELAVGDYTLNVFSEQCNGDKKTDYASGFQPIPLTVINPKEDTPEATFTAADDVGGTLTDVTTAMKYSVDGGVNWNPITGTAIDIMGVTAANGVQVYQPGNGVTTSDSDVQTINIMQPAKPTGLVGEACTTTEQNDGKITGVDTAMEYKLVTETNWQEITGTELTGLTNGTYAVRVKADGTALASETENVVVGEHICAAVGEWKTDSAKHWHECECGVELNKAAHTFGEWVIDREATETTKGSKHRTCSVCEYVETGEIPIVKPTPKPVIYKFLKGAEETYTQKKGESFTVKVDGAFDKFESVSIDGQIVDKMNYKAKSGSTILTFTADYMNTLSVGKHTIVVSYTDGIARTSFTIKGTPTPITGDNSNLALLLAMMFVSGGAVVIGLFVRKRRNVNR